MGLLVSMWNIINIVFSIHQLHTVNSGDLRMFGDGYIIVFTFHNNFMKMVVKCRITMVNNNTHCQYLLRTLDVKDT